MVVDLLAQNARPGRLQERFQAEIAELDVNGQKVLLVKPHTFMNLSGRSVREIMDFYHLPQSDLLVVCDDVNLPLGKLRVRARGSAGGHNGLRDIQAHLGSTDYARLRIGVGAAAEGELVNHVLSRFRPSEQAVIEEATEQAAQAVAVWIEHGTEVCMNQYNG